MAGFSAGDIAPKMVVLGLVIQQPDTVAGVGLRLAEQFASAQFSRSSPYNNLPRLAAQGYVRLIEEGEEPSQNRYEGTPKGVRALRQWLRRTTLPPVVRDALRGKLEFVELEDLAALVEIVGKEEAAYTFACAVAQDQVRKEQRSRRRASGKRVHWRVRLRGIQTKDEAALWRLMSRRLERLREDLEELLEDIATGEVAV